MYNRSNSNQYRLFNQVYMGGLSMKGDKYIIEIAETHTHYDDKGQAYRVHRIKGFNSLFLDEYALSKLNKVNTDSFFTEEEKRKMRINNYVDFFKEQCDIKGNTYNDLIFLTLAEILRREENK